METKKIYLTHLTFRSLTKCSTYIVDTLNAHLKERHPNLAENVKFEVTRINNTGFYHIYCAIDDEDALVYINLKFSSFHNFSNRIYQSFITNHNV